MKRQVVRGLGLLAIAGAMFAVAGAASAASGDCVGTAPVVCTYTATGSEQQFTVPAGVTSLHLVAIGGQGGSAGAAGGFGDRLEGDLAVTPGATLYVEVGGNGADGGFNGGAAGGGAGGCSGLGGSPGGHGG